MAQIETRQSNICLKPLEKMDEVLAQEYAKGEVQGLTVALRLVPTIVEDFEDQLSSLIAEQKEEKDASGK
jgi:hypothetical protein